MGAFHKRLWKSLKPWKLWKFETMDHLGQPFPKDSPREFLDFLLFGHIFILLQKMPSFMHVKTDETCDFWGFLTYPFYTPPLQVQSCGLMPRRIWGENCRKRHRFVSVLMGDVEDLDHLKSTKFYHLLVFFRRWTWKIPVWFSRFGSFPRFYHLHFQVIWWDQMNI